VIAVQTVIDAERPGLLVGEDAVNPWEDDVGGHWAHDLRIVSDLWRLRPSPPHAGQTSPPNQGTSRKYAA
jgi:hypothetical protein